MASNGMDQDLPLNTDGQGSTDEPAFYMSPQDHDLLVRTVHGEAASQPDVGKVAVAFSALNRLVSGKYGKSISDIVLAPAQYEPWTTRRGELLALPTDSPAYQRASEAVDAAISGYVPDPTNGAVNFANVGTVHARGDRAGRPGGWLTRLQNVTQIADHTFGNPDGPPVSWASLKGSPAPDASKKDQPSASGFGTAPPAASAQAKPAQPGPDSALDEDAIDALLTGRQPGSTLAAGAPPPAAPSPPSSPPVPVDGNPLRITVQPKAGIGARPADVPVAAPTAQPAASPASASDTAISEDELDALLSGKGPQGGAGAASPAPGAATASGPRPGAPAPSVGQRVADTVGSFAAGAMDLPIVGPAIRQGLIDTSSKLREFIHGETAEQARANATNRLVQATSDHPWANTAGNLYGNVAAMAPVVTAAPAAFGISKAPMLVRMLAGGATGAGIGGADGAVRAGTQAGAYLPSSFDEAAAGVGAAKGLAAGAAAVPAGAIIGAGANKLMSLVGRGPAAPEVVNINRLLGEIGITPQEAAARLQRMGPNATLADLDPALTVDAGTLASRGGAPTSILKNAMAERAANANSRVSELMDSVLGPKPDLTQEMEAGLARARRASSPHYEAARQAREVFDIDPILQDIDKRLNTAAGGEADVLNRVKSFLVTKDGLPKVSTDAVLKARQAIDDLAERLPQAETSAGKNARATLNEMRGKVDTELKKSPNIAKGDAAYAGEMTLRDAMQEGTELFQRGTRPEDFFRRLVSAKPGEADALRAGARVAIGDALSQARRGELAGAQGMFGAGSANRAKLQMLFPRAGEVLDALQNEAAMRATEQQVARGADAAGRANSLARYQVPTPQPTVGNDLLAVAGGMAAGDPSFGVLPAMARRTIGTVRGGMSARAFDNLAAGTARGYAATGAERDAFMNRLFAAANGGNNPGLVANQGVNLLLNATGADTRRRTFSLRGVTGPTRDPAGRPYRKSQEAWR